MKSMNIIINASGAKAGGAKTIVETFFRWLEDNDQHNSYIFIVGFPLSTKSNNIEVVYLPTNSLSSLLFSTIGVSYYCLKYRTNIVLSFMNMNTILPFMKRITYFHQALLFSLDIPKFRIYKLIIKSQRKSYFITQTEVVKNNLGNLLHSKTADISITTVWPGVAVPNDINSPDWYDSNDFINSKMALCPYTSIDFDYKNFEKIYNSYSFFKENNIKVVITADTNKYMDNDVFKFVGNCTLSEIHFLYKTADMVLFPSKHETVGLPIFESLYHGTPVILENVEYVRDIKNKFPYLAIIIDDNLTYSFSVDVLSKIEYDRDLECFKGEWEKVLRLVNAFS